MSAFTSNTSVQPYRRDDGTWMWVLTEELVWEIGALGSGLIVRAPEGFETNLGTIPALARPLVNPADPQAVNAYILHDWLLAAFGPTSQPFAASQLYEALRSLDVARWSRKLQTAAVVAAIDNW